jgi:hypothetical protein
MSRQSDPSPRDQPRLNALRLPGALCSTPRNQLGLAGRPRATRRAPNHEIQPSAPTLAVGDALRRRAGIGWSHEPHPSMKPSAATRIPWPGADGHSWDVMGFDGSQWILNARIGGFAGTAWGSPVTTRQSCRPTKAAISCFSICFQRIDGRHPNARAPATGLWPWSRTGTARYSSRPRTRAAVRVSARGEGPIRRRRTGGVVQLVSAKRFSGRASRRPASTSRTMRVRAA